MAYNNFSNAWEDQDFMNPAMKKSSGLDSLMQGIQRKGQPSPYTPYPQTPTPQSPWGGPGPDTWKPQAPIWNTPDLPAATPVRPAPQPYLPPPSRTNPQPYVPPTGLQPAPYDPRQPQGGPPFNAPDLPIEIPPPPKSVPQPYVPPTGLQPAPVQPRGLPLQPGLPGGGPPISVYEQWKRSL